MAYQTGFQIDPPVPLPPIGVPDNADTSTDPEGDTATRPQVRSLGTDVPRDNQPATTSIPLVAATTGEPELRVPLPPEVPGQMPSSYTISIKSGADIRVSPRKIQRIREVRSMPFVTIVTVPRPFVGAVGVAQTNALTAWSRLVPAPQIVMFGNVEGASRVAATIPNIEHFPSGLRTSPNGVPQLDSVLRSAELVAVAPVIVLANPDVVFGDDLINAIIRAQSLYSKFFMFGRRLEMPRPIQVESVQWMTSLDAAIVSSGRLAPDNAPHDYFVYTRGLFSGLSVPPLAFGRPLVDRWLINATHAITDVAVIDTSTTVMAVHQLTDAAAKRSTYVDPVWVGDTDAVENVNLLRQAAGLQPVKELAQIDWKQTIDVFKYGKVGSAAWSLKYDPASPLHLALTSNGMPKPTA